MRVLIVGGGIMGLSVAWGLGRMGHAVTVVEQGDVPNPLGSSVDEHRLIRYPYGAEAGYTRMVEEAYGAWEELWADLGERLYVETGTLAISSRGATWARDSAGTMARQGREVRWLDPDELARAFPFLLPDGIEEAFLVDSGGVLLARRILAALARHLVSRGVGVRPHTRARDVDPVRATITLESGEVLGADALVIAAGPWITRLLPDLARRVTPSRQIAVYMEPPPEHAARWATSPMILDIGREAGLYLVPPVGADGLKLGDHRFTRSGDPERDRVVEEGELGPLFELCRRRVRELDRYRRQRAVTCFYTVEVSERFIVEPLGACAWVMSPCSGHGFKFGPLLGGAVARALSGLPGGRDIPRWAAGWDA